MNDTQSSKSTPWWVLLIAGGALFFVYIIACVIAAEKPRSVSHLQLGMNLMSLFVGGMAALASLLMLIVGVAWSGRQAAVGPWAAVLLGGITVTHPNWVTAIGLAVVAAALIGREIAAACARRRDEQRGQ